MPTVADILRYHMCKLLTVLVLVVAAAIAQPPVVPRPTNTDVPSGAGNTVLIFVPQRLFNASEYEQVTGTLSRAGIYYRVLAADSGVCVSTNRDNRLVVAPDLTLRDVVVGDFAGLVLLSGPGQTLYWDDTLLHAVCRQFAAAGRVLAGIGTAPITLARAGVLKNRRATVARDRYAVQYIREHGARYRHRAVVTDNLIVTAAHVENARSFAQAVARLVLSRSRSK